MRFLFVLLSLAAAGHIHAQNTLHSGEEYSVEITVERSGKYKINSFSSPHQTIPAKKVVVTNNLPALAASTKVRGTYTVQSFASAGGLGTTRSGGTGSGTFVVLETKDPRQEWTSCGSNCPDTVHMEVRIK